MPKLPQEPPQKKRMKELDPDASRNTVPVIARSTATGPLTISTATASTPNSNPFPRSSLSGSSCTSNENSIPGGSGMSFSFSMDQSKRLPPQSSPAAAYFNFLSMTSRSAGQLFNPTSAMISNPLRHNSFVTNLQPFPGAVASPVPVPVPAAAAAASFTASPMQPHVAATATQLPTPPFPAPPVSANVDPTQNRIFPPMREQAAMAHAAATQYADFALNAMRHASIAAAAAGIPQPPMPQALVSLVDSCGSQQQQNLLATAATPEGQQLKHRSSGGIPLQLDPNAPTPPQLVPFGSQPAPEAQSTPAHEQNAPLQLTSQSSPTSNLVPTAVLSSENTRMEKAPCSGSESASSKNTPSEPLPALSPYPVYTAPTESGFAQQSGFEDCESSMNQTDSITGNKKKRKRFNHLSNYCR